MNAGWIYPHRDRCGIARYSTDYTTALDTQVTVIDINPEWRRHDRKRFFAAVAACDIIHLQYDTSAYFAGRNDFFIRMMKRLPVPAVVTLHEVYDENPFVFPRSHIRGNPVLRLIRRFLWDNRHPVDAACQQHIRHHFGARRILVHHDYHRKILIQKGLPEPLITVLPHPVHRAEAPAPFVQNANRQLRLGAHGFIQQAYDFDLLFATLDLLEGPWTFTWVGGIRSEDQRPVIEEICRNINRRGWNDRFRISGWIDEQHIGSRLAAIDLMLALFKNRSSSGSIARSLSHGKPVIATELPMTLEIADGNRTSHRSTAAPILTVPAEPDKIVGRIAAFAEDDTVRMRLYEGITAYIDGHSFDKMSRKLVTLYRELLTE